MQSLRNSSVSRTTLYADHRNVCAGDGQRVAKGEGIPSLRINKVHDVVLEWNAVERLRHILPLIWFGTHGKRHDNDMPTVVHKQMDVAMEHKARVGR